MEAPNTLYPNAVSGSSESSETGLRNVELEHSDLIDRFYESEGDPVIGTELSVRIFQHASFMGDPIVTPLLGGNGEQVIDDGKPLVLADYINFATKHHPDAVEQILDFLLLEAGTKEFEDIKSVILRRLNSGKS